MANNKPAAEVRLGKLTAVIWANETEKGVFYGVQFSRSWKDGDEWKRSDSFGRDDLLPLAKLSDIAHTRIFELQSEAKANRDAA